MFISKISLTSFRILLALATILATSVCTSAASLTWSEESNRPSDDMLSILPYPSASIDFINPYSNGDEYSMLIDALQEASVKLTKQPFEIREASGRGGANGMISLINEPRKIGYTLAINTLENLIIRAWSEPKTYSLPELDPLCVIAEAPLVLWVPEKSPIRDLNHLISISKAAYEAHRRDRDAPLVTIAGSGTGTQSKLVNDDFEKLAGTKLTFLPYTSNLTAAQSAFAGQSHAFWGPLIPLFYNNGMRPLAVATEERVKSFPSIPTFEDNEIALFAKAQYCIVVSSSVPAPRKQEILSFIQKLLQNPELKVKIERIGLTPVFHDSEYVQNEIVTAVATYMADIIRQDAQRKVVAE